jgi:hypothetical protein
MKKLIPAASGGPAAATDEGTSRRAFLAGGAGAAAGVAVILATPKVVSVLDSQGHGTAVDAKGGVTEPAGPAPREPVTDSVRNEHRGEVTVMSGTRETTYKDPALVKRLLDAAK